MAGRFAEFGLRQPSKRGTMLPVCETLEQRLVPANEPVVAATDEVSKALASRLASSLYSRVVVYAVNQMRTATDLLANGSQDSAKGDSELSLSANAEEKLNQAESALLRAMLGYVGRPTPLPPRVTYIRLAGSSGRPSPVLVQETVQRVAQELSRLHFRDIEPTERELSVVPVKNSQPVPIMPAKNTKPDQPVPIVPAKLIRPVERSEPQADPTSSPEPTVPPG